MKSFVSRGLIVLGGMLATPVLPQAVAPEAPVSKLQNDPRLAKLRQFFANCSCPLVTYAEDFIVAADANYLDWRLLPSIAMVESSGGKAYRNNNVLGWGSATSKFASVKEGIHAVASRMANSKLYRHKDVDGILRTYNTSQVYPSIVKQIMRTIGAAQPRLVLVAD